MISDGIKQWKQDIVIFLLTLLANYLCIDMSIYDYLCFHKYLYANKYT